MAIDAITSSPSNSALTGNESGLTQATDSTLGREEFLKLLMAQLENQDPLNPMENHEFVAQLATFSGLEQQILSNQKLDDLQLSQMSLANAQLATFIGKEVEARGNTISVGDGQAEPIAITLDAPAKTVDITVKDASGKTVYTAQRNDVGEGNHEIAWPGHDLQGNALPPGEYTVSLEAVDGQGNPTPASTLVTGVVTGVTFEHGYPELLIGDVRIQPADILNIEHADSTPPSSSSTPTAPVRDGR